MTVYVVVGRSQNVYMVTTNKEKAEAEAKMVNWHAEMGGGRGCEAEIVAKEVVE